MAVLHELAQEQAGWMCMLSLTRATWYDYKEASQYLIVYILTSIRRWLAVATAQWVWAA